MSERGGDYFSESGGDIISESGGGLPRNLHYAQHSARLTSLSKQYEFGMIFFAAMGAVLLIVFDGRSDSHAWLTPVLSLSLMLFACGSALRGRKMVSHIRSFDDRFSNCQF